MRRVTAMAPSSTTALALALAFAFACTSRSSSSATPRAAHAYSSPEPPLPRRSQPRSPAFPGVDISSMRDVLHHRPRRRTGRSGIDDDDRLRPLVPPFPNGPCGGTVVTLPREDIFPDNDARRLSSIVDDTLASLDGTALPPRDVSVWLPKEYSMAEHQHTRFPVLYCHDGQNAMEDASSWTGSSWRLIGALTRLFERGELVRTPVPPLVVFLPSADGDVLPGILRRRHAEYGDPTFPASRAHSDFVATTVHPYVTDRFRVATGPEHTSTIGTSLGGQASLLLLMRRPDLFGGAACLSPCFQAGTIAGVAADLALATDGGIGGIVDDETRSRIGEALAAVHVGIGSDGRGGGSAGAGSSSLRSKTIYIDNGGDVGDARVPFFDAFDHFTLNEHWWNPGYFWLDTHLQPSIDAVRWALDAGGVTYKYESIPGGRHNERAWAQRIHRPLLHLYG